MTGPKHKPAELSNQEPTPEQKLRAMFTKPDDPLFKKMYAIALKMVGEKKLTINMFNWIFQIKQRESRQDFEQTLANEQNKRKKEELEFYRLREEQARKELAIALRAIEGDGVITVPDGLAVLIEQIIQCFAELHRCRTEYDLAVSREAIAAAHMKADAADFHAALTAAMATGTAPILGTPPLPTIPAAIAPLVAAAGGAAAPTFPAAPLGTGRPLPPPVSTTSSHGALPSENIVDFMRNNPELRQRFIAAQEAELERITAQHQAEKASASLSEEQEQENSLHATSHALHAVVVQNYMDAILTGIRGRYSPEHHDDVDNHFKHYVHARAQTQAVLAVVRFTQRSTAERHAVQHNIHLQRFRELTHTGNAHFPGQFQNALNNFGSINPHIHHDHQPITTSRIRRQPGQ